MHMCRFVFLILLMSLFSLPSKVQAAEDVEELTYDQILSRLSQKKTYLQQDQSTAFDNVRIHVGMGFVNSLSSYEVANSSEQQMLTGMQLSVGIDLLSRSWYSEAAWRNFGYTRNGSAETGLRELDLKVGYRTDLTENVDLCTGFGLATRYLNYSDPSRDITFRATTPAFAFNVDFLAKVSRQVSAGLATSYRSSLISSTDRGSIDFGLQLTSFF